MGAADGRYPPGAYAPNGQLWWTLKIRPGTKKAPFGGEQKLSAWLAYNKEVGDEFTMADLRDALGNGVVPNNQEHLQRRLRTLREQDGWDIPSVKYDRDLEVGKYRLDVMGWHPGLGTPRPRDPAKVSAATKRLVRDRDGARCVLCGVGAGEPHPENGRPAVMTVGHVKPGLYRGKGDIGNLRMECTMCNEPARAEGRRPHTFEELRSDMLQLKNAELDKLKSWVEDGHRSRDRADAIFDAYRLAAPEDKDRFRASLYRTARRGKVEVPDYGD